MQITEIKNNLVKLTYNPAQENLVLSCFVIVRDEIQAFIGQVINLEATTENTAIIKLLFVFDEQGVISNYNGASPSINSQINIVLAREILELFVAQNPIYFGEIAQQAENMILDRSIFDQKVVICTEKQEEKDILSANFINQLCAQGAKVLAIDFLGTMDYFENKIVAGKDFKLPLNYETINFIYEKGLDDASGETKATIQEVFLEVQNYVKSLPEQFLPFETFKDVVDSQYEELELVELLLLKNKLLKFYDEGIFAQNDVDFKSLKNHIDKQNLTILDLSKVDEAVQKEMISYAYSVIENQNEQVYVLLNIEDENSDKKLLKQIYTAKKAVSILSCQYSFKYIKELKQLSKNVIMFAPIQQQSDFGGYNIFLNKLGPKEFVISGESTHNMPFIVVLKDVPQELLQGSAIAQETSQEQIEVQNVQASAKTAQKTFEDDETSSDFQAEQSFQNESTDINGQAFTDETSAVEITEQEILDAQIKQDVDEIFTAPTNFQTLDDDSDEFDVEALGDDEELLGETLTDDDLDFIQEGLSEDIFDDEPIVKPEGKQVPLPQIPQETDDSFSSVMEQQAQQIPSDEMEFSSEDILPAAAASTPIVPVYSADVEPVVQSDELVQGDAVSHAKYGKGIVEKLISYGDKTLYSINFDNVGRRLLDPNVTELKKV